MALGTASLSRRTLRAPSHQPRRPARSYLFSASPGKTAASPALPAGPRTSRRRRRRWPGVRREPGPPRLPEPLHWERRRQNSGAPPRAEPPARAAPPSPPNRRGDGGDTEPGAGSNGGPRPRPAPGPLPPSTPRLGSSPSASSRRQQDSRVRLPHPARSERSSPPHAARGGGTASHRRACQTRAGYLYPAGTRRPRPPPARPPGLDGSLESRPPCSPQLLPSTPSQVKTLATSPAPCSGLPHPSPDSGPGPGLARGLPSAGRRVGARVHLQRPPARSARTHPRHSEVPRGRRLSPHPQLRTPALLLKGLLCTQAA